MIRLQGVSHIFRNGRAILSDVDVTIPAGRKVALLGGAASGKSTIMSLLAGNIAPSHGRIERHAKTSFVAGFQGGFRVTQSGRQNIMFAARAYGADPFEVFDFVRDVTGFGAALDLPMRQLSLPNRISLSYVLAYALPFDIYLLDNVIGPVLSEIPDFAALCQEMYFRRMQEAGSIVATRNPFVAQKFCDSALLLREGKLIYMDDLPEALGIFHNDAMAADDSASPEAWLAGAVDETFEYEI